MKALVAEGQNSLRRVIVSTLGEKNFDVFLACDSIGVDRLLQEEAHLLLMDTQLISGRIPDFLSSLRQAQPSLPVILLTSNDYKTSENITDNHNVHCLVKPFDKEVLDHVIEKALREISLNDRVEKNLADSQPSKYLDLPDLPSVSIHPGMKKAVGLLYNVAESDITVLLSGESGVGKEVFARTLHERSRRRNKNFVGLNCACVPDSLLEAELFGCEKGSYTGATSRRVGKFELAQEGSILLDEVSEMDLMLQTKLLRVLQEKEIYRIGGDTPISLDVRVIATTNRDLKNWVKEGKFREDLFYRLNVISIKIPPLRERPEDVEVLAKFTLEKFNHENKQRSLVFSNEALESLKKYEWPGNVRELENVLLRTFFLTSDQTVAEIQFDDIHTSASFGEKNRLQESEVPQIGNSTFVTIEEMEKRMIEKALLLHDGNRVRAADSLGISVRTLRNKLKLYKENVLDG